MREIKFRAWDKISKQMFKVYSIEFRENGVWVCLDWKSKVTGLRENWLSPDRLELMQFTGIKDKNGKEIYEGDIVEWKINFSSGKDVIVFRDGRFELSDSYIIDSGYRSVDNINTHGEVIGNIFENPELINHHLT